MSKYGHVTILSSVRWDFMWQRHHAIAATVAASGRDVTFVEPHPRGIGHISSWVVARLRRHGSKASESTVKHAVPAGVSVVSWTPKMHLVDFCSSHTRRRTELASSGMVIAYLPSQTSRKHIERIRPETLVYDCVLDWQNAPAGFYPPAGFREFEQWITELSKQSRAAIISDSVTLAERLLRSIAEQTGTPLLTLHQRLEHSRTTGLVAHLRLASLTWRATALRGRLEEWFHQNLAELTAFTRASPTWTTRTRFSTHLSCLVFLVALCTTTFRSRDFLTRHRTTMRTLH